ncbi:hypothetical protein RB597_009653 [Gaeumannomyces tritici]
MDGKSARAHAQTLANTITLNQLTAKVKTDPAVDLTESLAQKLESYPKLVQGLVAAAPQPPSGQDTDSPPSPFSPTLEEKPYLLKDESADITHTLSDVIVALLVGDGRSAVDQSASPSQSSPALAAGDGSAVDQSATSSQLPPALVASLNRLLREGEVLHGLHQHWVVDIGSGNVAKIGLGIDPDHISNLQHINEHMPEIPTPRFLGALSGGRLTYIFMSRSQGVTLESIWPDLTVGQKLSVKQQLAEHLKRLRQKSPLAGQTRLGSFESGIYKDLRRSLRVSSAPLHSETEWNDFLCKEPGRTATAFIRMIRSFMTEGHRIVMTHGDLHPRNIMVVTGASDGGEADIRVTSILDWELAGWYPEHWEFVRALNTIGSRGRWNDWVEYLPADAIGQYPVEYSLDCLIDRWLG